MKRIGIVTALALGASHSPATAEAQSIFNGNGFYSQCGDAKAGSFEAAYCLGFVVGLSTVDPPTTARTLEDFKSRRGQVYCQPNGITNGQIYEIVRDYVRRTPRYRHMGMTYLYTLAMNEAYPCPNGASIRVLAEPGVLLYDPPPPSPKP